MTVRALPRHARTSGRKRWVARPREGRLPRVRARGIPQAGLPEGRLPAGPLAGPVAITQRAVLGDRIRRPTAWCEMAACISRYDDPAALGEAGIRARAVGAGWRQDPAGRLICPFCQRRRPGLWAAYPVAGQDNPPARRPGQQAQPAGPAGGISAVWATRLAWHRRLLGGQHLAPCWPRLLAALVCGPNGWNTPPSALAASTLGMYSAGPAGPSRSPGTGHRAGRHAAHRPLRVPRRRHPPWPGTEAAGADPAAATSNTFCGTGLNPLGMLSWTWPPPAPSPLGVVTPQPAIEIQARRHAGGSHVEYAQAGRGAAQAPQPARAPARQTAGNTAPLSFTLRDRPPA